MENQDWDTGPPGHRPLGRRGPQASGPLGRRAAGPSQAVGHWAAGLFLAKPRFYFSIYSKVFVSIEKIF